MPDESVTALMSFHVWQHFSCQQDGYDLLREVKRVLAPGGTMCIHAMITAVPQGRSGRLMALAKQGIEAVWGLYSTIRRLGMRFGAPDFMHITTYDIQEMLHQLRALGFEKVEVRSVTMRSNQDTQFCFFATKPSAAFQSKAA